MWFALSKIGAIEIPFNPFHKGTTLEYFINYSDAELIVISAKFYTEMKAIEGNLTNIKNVIIHGADRAAPFERFSEHRYEELLNHSSSPYQANIKNSDLLSIMFTSGTTGPSKGVMITHNQAVFNATQYAEQAMMGKKDITYHYLPLFHNAPQAVFLAALISEGSVILKKGFSASTFWNDVKKWQCTVSGLFEAVARILYLRPKDDGDTQNPLRALFTGHISSEIHEPFEKRFGVKLLNIFGMTEGDHLVSSKLDDIEPGSFGKSTSFFDARVFDSEDRELAPNQVGELVCRPLQPDILFQGYYKMPEKTLEVFRNLWFHTGDIVYKDEEGSFYFVGREKDMIRRGGENISALEVEEVVESHPDVGECAAVAVPSDIWGEDVKILIVPKPGKQINPEKLIEFCDEKMAYFMVPRYVEYVESFSRTEASQRVIKKLLKRITPNTWDREDAGVKIRREIERSV